MRLTMPLVVSRDCANSPVRAALRGVSSASSTSADPRRVVSGEMTRLGSADVLEAELTPRRAALTGEFAQSLETTSGIVNRISALALYGLSLSEINRYISGVQSVSAEQVRKFA